MILKRFFEEGLAQASYLVGCPACGECVIIDPNRDLQQYLVAAEKAGMKIAAATETHIHADFLSGARELAKITGAKLYVSDEGGPDWRYDFRDEENVIPVKDGDSFSIGDIRFDIKKTPGHTPEHISFLMTNLAVSLQPAGIFTGDFIFVGDVGRPDLLEQAAGVKGTMEPGARELYLSISSFKPLPDYLPVWPGHGAGSACGKSLGDVPFTSLGYERISNWAFKASSEDSFVREALSGQPEPPKYFAQMKKWNKQGPPFIDGKPMPARGRDLPALLRNPYSEVTRPLLLDVRAAEGHQSDHIPGTLNIPLVKGFSTYSGWLVPYGRRIELIANREEDAFEATRRLRLIGLDDVTTWYGPDVLDAWRRAGNPVARTESESMSEALSREQTIVDVRGASEWAEGHVPNALHIPLGYLVDRCNQIPKDRAVAVHCRAGERSAIAASVLEAIGIDNVFDIRDGWLGYEALQAAGTPS